MKAAILILFVLESIVSYHQYEISHGLFMDNLHHVEKACFWCFFHESVVSVICDCLVVVSCGFFTNKPFMGLGFLSLTSKLQDQCVVSYQERREQLPHLSPTNTHVGQDSMPPAAQGQGDGVSHCSPSLC